MTETLDFNGHKVELFAKKIKHCYLRVRADGVITLSYNPRRFSQKYLREILAQNQDMLLARISALPKQQPNYLETGSDIYYLGRCYNLQVAYAPSEKIEISGDSLALFVPDANDYTAKYNLLNNWYSAMARQVFPQHYAQYLSRISHWQVEPPQLHYRKLRSSWGNYNRIHNRVTLNTQLVKASPEVINYIVAHELCHIRHFNHSHKFYAELNALHPTWREQKAELNQLTHHYLERR